MQNLLFLSGLALAITGLVTGNVVLASAGSSSILLALFGVGAPPRSGRRTKLDDRTDY